MGNFPQAFSHVSLINSAFRLSGSDPLAPIFGGSRLIADQTISQTARLQRMKRLGRVAVRRRSGAAR